MVIRSWFYINLLHHAIHTFHPFLIVARTEKGEKLAIADAIHSGLVLVEYHGGEATHTKPEVVEKTYAVHGVVDQRLKKKVRVSL